MQRVGVGTGSQECIEGGDERGKEELLRFGISGEWTELLRGWCFSPTPLPFQGTAMAQSQSR